ncbi:MAG: hypothetical protein ACP5OZ_02080 [Candidatus Woesearchaeota archaeon]
MKTKKQKEVHVNMTYRCKSVIIGRKRKKDAIGDRFPCFINLSSVNNPHISKIPPFRFLDFKAHKIIIKGLNVNYLIPGNDLVINNLESITIIQEGPHITLTGIQKEEEREEKEKTKDLDIEKIKNKK